MLNLAGFPFSPEFSFSVQNAQICSYVASFDFVFHPKGDKDQPISVTRQKIVIQA